MIFTATGVIFYFLNPGPTSIVGLVYSVSFLFLLMLNARNAHMN